MIEKILMSDDILCIGPLLVLPVMLLIGLIGIAIDAFRKSLSDDALSLYLDRDDDGEDF